MAGETTNDEKEYQQVFSASITKNRFGSAYQATSPCFLKAIGLVKQKAESKPRVLDLGCAFGFTSKILLEHKFHVIANDLSSEHLDTLWSESLDQHPNHLEIRAGDFLEMDFDAGSLDAIFALRVLHFMRGEQVRRAFQLFHKWLKPTGVLLVTCSTPFRSTFDQRFWQKFGRELRSGQAEWPGFINVKEFSACDLYTRHVQEQMNYFVPELLVREARVAGLDTFECGFENRPSESENVTLTKEYCFLLAVKDVFAEPSK